uniref:Cyclic nucleotide-binding domain-containing protein n=1 Tax=Acrobeloides nanus TaxID=290746 RepID=A0A914BU97_9BILA
MASDREQDAEIALAMATSTNKFARLVRMMMLIKRWTTGQNQQETEERLDDRNMLMFKFFETVAGTKNLSIIGNHQEESMSWFNKIWHLSINETNNFYYRWSAIVMLSCIYNLVLIPVMIFAEFRQSYYKPWLVANAITDVVNLFDILIQSKREFMEDGVCITEPKAMLVKYFKSRDFILDLLSVTPSDLVMLIFPNLAFVRLNRLLKIHRIFDFMERTEIRTNFPHLFRLLRLIVVCFVIFHWNACVYFLLSILYGYQDSEMEDWVFSYEKILDPLLPKCNNRLYAGTCLFDEDGLDAHERHTYVDELLDFWEPKKYVREFSNLTKKYSLSFYWSSLTLVNLGEQPSPTQLSQMLFEIVDTLLGLVIFAIIVGDIGNMVTSMNLARSTFEEKKDGCKRYMRFRKVNQVLERKVVEWFEYTWTRGQAKVDESKIVEYLPSRLHGQMSVQIHMDTIRKVRLFQDCEAGLLYELVLRLHLQIFSPGDYICRKGDVGKDCEAGLLYELVLRLHLQIFSPGDYICRKGDVGKEMYIIKRGCLEVVSPDGLKVFATLNEGAVFGELSILNIPGNKNGNRRTASIRAVGYSDLYVLTKDDLWDAIREFPDAKKSLIDKGKEILRKDNLLKESDDEAELSDMEIEGIPIEERLSKIRKNLYKLEETINKYASSFHGGNAEMKRRITQLEQRYKTRKHSIQGLYSNMNIDF